MKPLIVFLLVFSLSSFASRLWRGTFQLEKSIRFGLSAMLLFSSLGHFLYSQGMALMIPEIIPYKLEIVYITGLFEIALAVGLLIPNFRKLTGWVFIFFLIAVLPANIRASIFHLNFQTAQFDGYGLSYLWFRIPLQLFFIAWTYFSCIRPNKKPIH